jgi:hypothetical protein
VILVDLGTHKVHNQPFDRWQLVYNFLEHDIFMFHIKALLGSEYMNDQFIPDECGGEIEPM